MRPSVGIQQLNVTRKHTKKHTHAHTITYTHTHTPVFLFTHSRDERALELFTDLVVFLRSSSMELLAKRKAHKKV